MSSVIAFAPKHNSPGKSDADEFQRGARLFVEHYGSDPKRNVHLIDNSLGFNARGRQLCDALWEHHKSEIKEWGFFCHGWSRGIQLGVRSPIHPQHNKAIWESFVKELGSNMLPPLIGLYACSTGDDPPGDEGDDGPGAGDNSFADLLRDALCWYGATQCRVVAHETAGHAWHNPDVVLFDGNGNPYGGAGGDRVVPLRVPYRARHRAAFRRLLLKNRMAWDLIRHSMQRIQKAVEKETR